MHRGISLQDPEAGPRHSNRSQPEADRGADQLAAAATRAARPRSAYRDSACAKDAEAAAVSRPIDPRLASLCSSDVARGMRTWARHASNRASRRTQQTTPHTKGISCPPPLAPSASLPAAPARAVASPHSGTPDRRRGLLLVGAARLPCRGQVRYLERGDPGALDGEDFLIFEANGWHNVVHIASGAFLALMSSRHARARAGALAFGAIYGLAAVIGLIDGHACPESSRSTRPTTSCTCCSRPARWRSAPPSNRDCSNRRGYNYGRSFRARSRQDPHPRAGDRAPRARDRTLAGYGSPLGGIRGWPAADREARRSRWKPSTGSTSSTWSGTLLVSARTSGLAGLQRGESSSGRFHGLQPPESKPLCRSNRGTLRPLASQLRLSSVPSAIGVATQPRGDPSAAVPGRVLQQRVARPGQPVPRGPGRQCDSRL